VTRFKSIPGGRGKKKWTTGIDPEILTEGDVVKAIRDLLRSRGVFHWKFSPGPFGKQAGIADILGVYKVRVEDLVKAGVEEVGIFTAIEVKKPGKKPTDAQKRFLANVRDGAGIAFWADCIEDVIKGMGWDKKTKLKKKRGSR
jgi:hypothetical protein